MDTKSIKSTYMMTCNKSSLSFTQFAIHMKNINQSLKVENYSYSQIGVTPRIGVKDNGSLAEFYRWFRGY